MNYPPAEAPYNCLDKRQIRRSFNKAAATYETADDLQQEVAAVLLQRLNYLPLKPQTVTDLGCGTGRLLQALYKRYPKAQLYGVDIADNMLKQAQRKNAAWLWRNNNRHFICADAMALPLPNHSVDLLVSNLTLQWCDELSAVLQECARILKPGGTFFFSTFGPDTLQELRESWAVTDTMPHVNRFTDMHHLGDQVLAAGLAHPVMDREIMRRYHADVGSLMRSLKQIGAHNVQSNRIRGLSGKRAFQNMREAYARFRSPQGLPATYEVLYGYAKGAEIAPPGSIHIGETRIPLSKVGKK